MRKISAPVNQIIGVLLGLCATLSVSAGFFAHELISPGEYRPFLVLAVVSIAYFSVYFAVLRAFLAFFPIPEGEIKPGSTGERNYFLTQAWLFFGFHPLTRSVFLIVPMTGSFYRLLGAQIGRNTYTAGIIMDPHFVQIGNDSLLGHTSLLVPHIIDGDRIAHHRIIVGNQVTLGAHSIIMAGVKIGDRAVIAMNSVVTIGTQIGPGEIWGGTPAKLIGKREQSE